MLRDSNLSIPEVSEEWKRNHAVSRQRGSGAVETWLKTGDLCKSGSAHGLTIALKEAFDRIRAKRGSVGLATSI